MHQKVRLLISFFIVILLGGCEDYVENSNIPDANVNLEINLANVEWQEAGLLGMYNAVIYSNVYNSCYPTSYQGYKGIIIMLGSDGQFYAFDRCCTFNPVTGGHKLNVNGSIATCPVDSSRFLLGEGYSEIANGPATLPLRMYRTSRSGNILRIYN